MIRNCSDCIPLFMLVDSYFAAKEEEMTDPSYLKGPFGGSNYCVPTGGEHKFTQKGILFVLSKHRDLYSDRTRDFLDWTLPNGKKGRVLINNPAHTNTVVGYVKAGDIKTAKMFAGMTNNDQLSSLWLERWKQKRCLHGGVPNKNAMKLLVGLRKETPKSYGVTTAGLLYEDKSTHELFQAGLVSRFIKTFTGKHGIKVEKVAMRTNLAGHEVLCHWAQRSKVFAGYLEAYRPKDWERDYTANLVLNTMQGMNDQSGSPFYTEASLTQALMPAITNLRKLVP